MVTGRTDGVYEHRDIVGRPVLLQVSCHGEMAALGPGILVSTPA